jgi:hypothetical protein
VWGLMVEKKNNRHLTQCNGEEKQESEDWSAEI